MAAAQDSGLLWHVYLVTSMELDELVTLSDQLGKYVLPLHQQWSNLLLFITKVVIITNKRSSLPPRQNNLTLLWRTDAKFCQRDASFTSAKCKFLLETHLISIPTQPYWHVRFQVQVRGQGRSLRRAQMMEAQMFYHNIFCILFNIKTQYILYFRIFCVWHGVYACAGVCDACTCPCRMWLSTGVNLCYWWVSIG